MTLIQPEVIDYLDPLESWLDAAERRLADEQALLEEAEHWQSEARRALDRLQAQMVVDGTLTAQLPALTTRKHTS